ncbi:MAG: winged helix family two component transcriptional regulator [Thermoleophilia bacterium]|nr:winged helix family two component transcriptional regulator [Thermoleophilia bacterium]
MSADATTELPIRLLLVEDETKLALIIAKALTAQGYSVDVTTRGDEAYALLARPGAPWSLVVLDRMLPGLDGVTVCRQLREAGNDVPILMLTALEAIDERIVGLDAGANDYLPKPFALRELYARVRALLRAHRPQVLPRDVVIEHAPEHLVVGDLTLDVDGLVAFRGEARIDLRPKEAAILASLMRQPDRVVSRWTIFDAAWGDVDVPSANHLDVHIRRIREKVDRPFDRASIETVRGAGYRIRGDGR